MYMQRELIDNREVNYAIKHALSAYRIFKEYMSQDKSIQIVSEGYRYDDDNGISVFLSYEGQVKGTANG